MKNKRNFLFMLLVGTMIMACMYTVYATTSQTFTTTDGKTKATFTWTTKWNTLTKDVGTANMEITSSTASDARYSMTCSFAYKDGVLVTNDIGYGYGSATATAKANADEFRYRAYITKSPNGGTALKSTGWISVTQ